MSLTSLLPSFQWIYAKFGQSQPRKSSRISDTVSVLAISRPRFDELPLKQGDPKGSAWGLWGDQDERGTLNLITDDVVRAASKEAIYGKVVNLK
jgi:hypothetical protein